MGGELAPLREFCDICDEFRAALIVDEAHSTGAVCDYGFAALFVRRCQEVVLSYKVVRAPPGKELICIWAATLFAAVACTVFNADLCENFACKCGECNAFT